MSPLSLIRWSGLAALLAGVAFIVDILLVLTVDADWTNVVYIIAALLMLAGLVGLGLVIIPPISIVLGDYGGILFGLLWLALGYVLWSWRGKSTEQAARVS